MNDENLIPFGQRTESEQREIARAGGVASGEARREKKTMRTRLEYLMNTPDSNGTEPGDTMAAALVAAASGGNLKAIKMIGDYLGDFKQRIEVEDTTPKMTETEANAIYWAYVKQAADLMLEAADLQEFKQVARQQERPSELLREAERILGKRPEDWAHDVLEAFGD